MMGLSGSYATAKSGVLALEDIATGLSRIPRFGGQTIFRWSVAEHLLSGVAHLQDMGYGPHEQLHFALHDAHEAMTMDVPTSFKTWCVRFLQWRLDRRLYKALNLPRPILFQRRLVKAVDRWMLLAEASLVTPPKTYVKIVRECGGAQADWQSCKAVKSVMLRCYSDQHVADIWLETVKGLIYDAV